jgi:hypothetical protein
MTKRQTVRLVPYDRLTLEQREEGLSMWKGEKGIYVIERTGEVKPGRPVSRVYLNRKYLSGLFPGKRLGEYSADLKEVDGKKYLTFRPVGDALIEVYERVRAA